MVSKLKQQELSDAIHSTPGFRQTSYMADCIAERIIELGWVPIEDFPDEELPVPTQAVVNDVMERIISGLPERVLKSANPEGNAVYPMGKLYDVASLHPVEVNLNDLAKSGEYHFKSTPTLDEAVNTWAPVPEFANYQVNCLGEFRNRFTRRILDLEPNCNGKYVEMHDKEGFPHLVSVDYIVKEVFGE
ncbi:hypothetical protein PBI_INGRID_80 [Arthrobacter phage Ingrid]|nr:hypothetical protein PBI_INGRID_80 [Arthrobacter phage Ingrid]QFG11056.1 hypothetical protein PBI_LORETTA_76 [Arthrobacter phage Loretta]